MIYMKEIVYQGWLESERGWGQRPNGYSLHLSLGDRKRYIENYWDRMPDDAPREYSRPSCNPKVAKVTEKLYNKIKEKMG